MSKKKMPYLFFISVLLIFSLTACNIPLDITVNQANLELTITAQALIIEQQAQSPTPSFTPIVIVVTATDDGSSSNSGAIPIDGPASENIATTTNTPIPPATGAPTVTVSIATNCRTGPGQAYPSIYGMPVGISAEVVGKNTSTNYWIIKIPSGNGTCWLWGQYATVTGDTSGLPTVQIPPTPTPSATPTPTVTKALAPIAPSNASATLQTCTTNNKMQTFTATFTWADNSTNETGFNIYVNSNFADGSSKDQLVGSVGPNTTSYTVSSTAIGKTPPIIKVEAFSNTGSSTRVSTNALDLSSCP